MGVNRQESMVNNESHIATDHAEGLLGAGLQARTTQSKTHAALWLWPIAQQPNRPTDQQPPSIQPRPFDALELAEV